MSVVKPKPKLSPQPITTNTNYPMNQSELSELEGNTCNRNKARENACEQVVIDFGFTSDWSRKWRKILLPIRERSKAKPK